MEAFFTDSSPTGPVPSECKKVSWDLVYHVTRNGGSKV